MQIEFNLSEYALNSQAVVRACEHAFGARVSRLGYRNRPVRIRCTSEQFVRFLVERNRGGGSNGWKELNVELFDEPRFGATQTYVDVSK